jgi:NADPH2:quinone reductase
MRAIVCTQYGGPEALELLDLPSPAIGEDELLISVRRSSVNFPDTLQIQGLYQDKPGLPFVPGSEAAGIVESVGSAVLGFQPGDRVAVLTGIGAFAEMAVANADAAIKLPESVSLDFAASFYVAYGTAYLALCRQAKVTEGETVLVLGAAGGVGLAAIEIAKALGARVIAAASSKEKLEVARTYGADALVNYSNEDLKTAVRELTDNQGVDVVFDPVGDSMAEPAMRTLRWNGRYMIIGFAGGSIPKIPLNLLLLKNASAIGTFMGSWASRNPELNAQNLSEIFAMHTRGLLRGAVRESFSLADTPRALRRMMDRQTSGKLLIEVAG